MLSKWQKEVEAHVWRLIYYHRLVYVIIIKEVATIVLKFIKKTSKELTLMLLWLVLLKGTLTFWA